ncbi:5-oxoprolinase subunit C family protein [Pedobacter sp. PWIIR3]
MGIKILKPGLLSTIQDLGRTGYQKDGVIVSGAMDTLALRIGNLLVGNAEGEAGIELTLLGGSMLFEQDQIIAITGADLSAKVDDMAAPLWKPFLVNKGSILSFGKPISGCRAYVMVQGGFELIEVLGSNSTYIKAGFGGWDGRALRTGDAIPFRNNLKTGIKKFGWSADLKFYPSIDNNVIRIIEGPHFDWFKPLGSLLKFKLSNQADRMGYRLEGAKLVLKDKLELLSTAVTFGTVQVPPDGNPIVLMADHQTTGGYPIMAQVIGVDLTLLAQKKPGDELVFELSTLENAQNLLVRREELIKQLKQTLSLKHG